MEAIELAQLAGLFDRLARFHECAKVGAMDEKRSLRIRRFKSGRDPSSDRVLMRPDKGAQFADRVAVMEFDAAAVEPPRHRLPRPTWTLLLPGVGDFYPQVVHRNKFACD